METPTVTVRGEAVLRAEPDEATLWIMLTALEEDPGHALTDVSRRSDGLIAVLNELGIAKAERTTTGVTVYEEFDHTQGGRRSLGHRAIANVSASLTDAEVIGRLIVRATTELQARIYGPHWRIASGNPVRLDAAREAAADAQRKARPYAEGVGARLGPLIKLAEPDAAHVTPRIARGAPSSAVLAGAGGQPMPIEPGEHEVSAAIDATFTLELD
jgi:uncharacterized protein YggE